MRPADTTPADLVLRSGTVVTMDPRRPRAEAVAIRGDTLVAVGTDAEVDSAIGPSTEVIELAGRLVVPGFIEGHGHLTGLGAARMQLDLRGARRWGDVVALVAEAARAAQPGAWICGRGWHQDRWDETPAPNVAGLPLHHALSRAAPRNPVLLRHASGHAVLANAPAMARAGLGRDTPDPPGGEILRDTDGEPTGAFIDAAAGLVGRPLREHQEARSPQEVEAETRRQIDLAAHECVANGITTFHDAGARFDTIAVYRKVADERGLPLRLYVMIGEPDDRIAEALPEARLVGYGGRRLTVRAVKRVLDGALGARSGWMLEPYADRPDTAGLCCTRPEAIAATAELAIDNGLQLCVHAIGDRANREALDLYERTFAAHPSRRGLRWRIEHAQHLHPDDIGRFARLGVVASMQANHCTGDGPAVVRALGERRARQGAYVWQSLLRSGATLINGTDAPVESVSPIDSFTASVTRRLADGTRFYPQQCMSREQALHSYTLAPAYAAFEERLKGSLVPGKLADLVVLSRDILAVPDDELPGTEVLYTIVGGNLAYES